MIRLIALFCSLTLAAIAVPAPAWSACAVQSGPQTTALIELYTSEGCSSCPPADRRLAQYMDTDDALKQIVPIALHVGYWDDIGWKDPYAKPAFAARQSWLVAQNHHRTVYTPHFFVSGTEVQSWSDGLSTQVARIDALPARAQIAIKASSASAGQLHVDASASSETSPNAALFLAVTEDRLVSNVRAGENSGVTLHHEHVVRQWIGPLALSHDRVATMQDIQIPTEWKKDNLGVVGFVEDEQTGQVLQAVAATQCAKT